MSFRWFWVLLFLLGCGSDTPDSNNANGVDSFVMTSPQDSDEIRPESPPFNDPSTTHHAELSDGSFVVVHPLLGVIRVLPDDTTARLAGLEPWERPVAVVQQASQVHVILGSVILQSPINPYYPTDVYSRIVTIDVSDLANVNVSHITRLETPVVHGADIADTLVVVTLEGELPYGITGSKFLQLNFEDGQTAGTTTELSATETIYAREAKTFEDHWVVALGKDQVTDRRAFKVFEKDSLTPIDIETSNRPTSYFWLSNGVLRSGGDSTLVNVDIETTESSQVNGNGAPGYYWTWVDDDANTVSIHDIVDGQYVELDSVSFNFDGGDAYWVGSMLVVVSHERVTDTGRLTYDSTARLYEAQDGQLALIDEISANNWLARAGEVSTSDSGQHWLIVPTETFAMQFELDREIPTGVQAIEFDATGFKTPISLDASGVARTGFATENGPVSVSMAGWVREDNTFVPSAPPPVLQILDVGDYRVVRTRPDCALDDDLLVLEGDNVLGSLQVAQWAKVFATDGYLIVEGAHMVAYDVSSGSPVEVHTWPNSPFCGDCVEPLPTCKFQLYGDYWSWTGTTRSTFFEFDYGDTHNGQDYLALKIYGLSSGASSVVDVNDLGTFSHLTTHDDVIYLSFRQTPGEETETYHLHTLDVSDPGNPVLSDAMLVPGDVIHVQEDYALAFGWQVVEDETLSVLSVLEFGGDKVVRTATHARDGYHAQISVYEDTAVWLVDGRADRNQPRDIEVFKVTKQGIEFQSEFTAPVDSELRFANASTVTFERVGGVMYNLRFDGTVHSAYELGVLFSNAASPYRGAAFPGAIFGEIELN